jgi:hypothetical protein
MFALSSRGLRSLRWPFHRPQGRRSPIDFRPTLETLEDRNLLSAALPPSLFFSTPSLAQSSANAAHSAPTNANSPGGQQNQSSQQVILAASQPEFSSTSSTNLVALFNGLATGGLTSAVTLPITNQPGNSSTPKVPGQSPSFSTDSPFGFLGYPALQDLAVNTRSALGYGVYTQNTPPGLFLVGGAHGAEEVQPVHPPQAPPPPPPPPQPRISTPSPDGVETADTVVGEDVSQARDLIRPVDGDLNPEAVSDLAFAEFASGD